MKYILTMILGSAIVTGVQSWWGADNNQAVSVVYSAPQSTSAWLWSQIMWWLIPTAIVVVVAIAAFHGFVSGYTRLKYPAHRKISVAEAKRDEGVYKAQVGTALARSQLLEAQRAKYENVTPAIQVESAPTPSTITLQQAISQSTERAWIVGQASTRQANPDVKDFAGKLLTLDYQTTHIAIIGATGGGKTASSAMLLALYARKFGVHPIVLDGKRGQDWKKYDGVVEWHLMTAETFESQIKQLMSIFEKRWQWLLDNGYDNIYSAQGKRPQPILVIFEEFGYVWSSLPKETQAALTNPVNDLFRLCRSAGIILCFVDQAPKKWPDQARGNAKFVFCYKIKGMIANAFSEYFVDRLADSGMFSRDNVFYDAWFTANLIDLNGMFQPLRRRYLGEQSRTEQRTPTNANERPLPVENATNVPNADVIEAAKNVKYPLPAMVRSSFVRTGSWEEAAQRYFATYRDADHIDWVKAMAELANDGRPYTAFKGGLSSNLFHKYSPKGKERMRLVA